MSVPTLFSSGSPSQGATGATITWAAGHQADDIGILYVETAAQAISTPSGWTLIGSGTTGTPGAADAIALQAFWKRATSGAEADVVLPDAGDHIRGRIFIVRGCETSGSPISGTPTSDTEATAQTAVSIPAGTTLDAECYVMAAVGNSTDSTSNQTTTGAWGNASLANFARIGSGNHSSGHGGGFDVAAGEKAVAGSWGTTTTTLATASPQVRIAFALKPPSGGGGGGAVTEGGVFVVTGVKATAGVVSATTATMDAASNQARVMIALKPETAPPVNLPPVVDQITDKVAAVDVELSFGIFVSDPEDDTLTLSLEVGDTDVPTGATINENVDGTYDFSWTPDSTQVGEWNIILRVTDGTNTVDQQFSISVLAEPDPDILTVARAIADRARTDIESAEALCDLLDDTQQMNANVIKEVRELIADLQESRTYLEGIIEDLEDGEVET